MKYILTVPFLLTAVLMVGCGGGDKWTAQRPEVYPVRGKVTHQGKPVVGATVTFRPDGEELPAASGRTGESGEYELTTFAPKDGAVAGEHKITVTLSEKGPEPPAIDPNNPQAMAEAYFGPNSMRNRAEKAKSLLPEKYGNFETSGLFARVTEGENTVDLPLD